MVPFWRSISRCFLFSSWHEKGILYGCLSSFPPQFPRYLGIWYLILFLDGGQLFCMGFGMARLSLACW